MSELGGRERAETGVREHREILVAFGVRGGEQLLTEEDRVRAREEAQDLGFFAEGGAARR